MNIIDPKIECLKDTIQQVDDNLITALAYIAFQCKKTDEIFNIRDQLYTSIYKPKNLERKEQELEVYLKTKEGQTVRTENQNEEYKKIKINTNDMGPIKYRFYIAPNPEYMHEIVKKLVDIFTARNIPVRFKYQLTTKMEQCDRIIIYSDENNKHRIEEAIKYIYNSSEELFKGCERSKAWLYPSKVKGVYIAPETKGEAYSNVFSEMILEAKETINYLYGVTNTNKSIKVESKQVKQAIDYMKTIICSILLRKGLLLTIDGKSIRLKDKNVKVDYNYDTGVLEHSNTDIDGFHSVRFYQTQEGKKALINNFYNVSTIKQQLGIETRFLTIEERMKEVYRNLYPDKFPKQLKL